jgi:Spy/CpxP family protein refolding chaperone
MKPIRTTIFALCIAAKGYATQAQATPDQTAPPPAPNGHHGPHGPPGLDINRLTVLLDLDRYQQGQVQQVLTDQRNAMRAERQAAQQAAQASGTRPSFADMQARRAQAQQDLIDKLSGVLTDVQITKLKVLLEPPHGGFGGPPPGATGTGANAGTGTSSGTTAK